MNQELDSKIIAPSFAAQPLLRQGIDVFPYLGTQKHLIKGNAEYRPPQVKGSFIDANGRALFWGDSINKVQLNQ